MRLHWALTSSLLHSFSMSNSYFTTDHLCFVSALLFSPANLSLQHPLTCDSSNILLGSSYLCELFSTNFLPLNSAFSPYIPAQALRLTLTNFYLPHLAWFSLSFLPCVASSACVPGLRWYVNISSHRAHIMCIDETFYFVASSHYTAWRTCWYLPSWQPSTGGVTLLRTGMPHS